MEPELRERLTDWALNVLGSQAPLDYKLAIIAAEFERVSRMLGA